MAVLVTIAILLFGYVTAQDADCDVRQNIGPGESFYINNNYKAGRVCQYIVTCTDGYNCRFDCNLNMPNSANCGGDRFLFSKTGDPVLADADAYCGQRSLSVVSTGRSAAGGLSATQTSPGGNISCHVSCQAEPIILAPPACVCGEGEVTTIVNGVETKTNAFPMVATLMDSSTELFHCGGVIISKRFIMTAAQCLDQNQNKPNAYYASLGDHNIGDGTRYDFDRYIIHENFDRNTYDYNIALGRTAAVIGYTPTIQPVCLPFKYVGLDLTGTVVTKPGWTSKSFGGPTSAALRKVDVTIVDQNRCKATAGTFVSNRQICTNGTDDLECQLDTGAPYFVRDISSGLLFSVGIISYVVDCHNHPRINTRVTEMLGWVVNNDNSQFCVIR